jgi:hypothetical protein
VALNSSAITAHAAAVRSASLSGEHCVNAQLCDSTVLQEVITSLGCIAKKKTESELMLMSAISANWQHSINTCQ